MDALALIVHRSAEQVVGRRWVKKLRKLMKFPRDLDLSSDTNRQIKSFHDNSSRFRFRLLWENGSLPERTFPP